MKFGVTHKLFLAFLLTSVAVVTLMVLLMQQSFDRGFLNYINQVEIERLEYLAENLEQAYAEHNDWRFLRRNRWTWRRFLITSNPRLAAQRGAQGLSQTASKPPKQTSPDDDPLQIAPRISLLDVDKKLVVGNPNTDNSDIMHSIQHQRQTVGWLSITPLQVLTDELDRQFLEQQSQTFYAIALAAMGIGLLVSMLLARHLLQPIKALAQGTHSLTAGRFDTRIQVDAKDELGQLAADFNTLAYTLESNEQARRQWVADISHELRTPLTVLLGEIEAMEDGVRPLNQDNLKSLHGESLRLNQLVADLYELSLSDIGALNYRKAVIDLIPLLIEVLTRFDERFKRHDIGLETDLYHDQPMRVFADSGRLFQLFSNLLENALRYTYPGGCLQVSCQALEQSVMIHFHDSAPGVAEEVLPRLFERLFRVDSSRNRDTGGAGLGLSIAKNIVEAHGGEIHAKPSPLGGLWIEIKLPSVKKSS